MNVGEVIAVYTEESTHPKVDFYMVSKGQVNEGRVLFYLKLTVSPFFSNLSLSRFVIHFLFYHTHLLRTL